jgi:hypothetical protein
MAMGPKPTCLCGICAKCKRRACTRLLRARKAAVKTPWARSVRVFTLEHLGFGQSSLSDYVPAAQQLLARSRRLRQQALRLLPAQGRVC